jgi:thiamine-phosphate pyrophosphorylase
MRSNIYRIIDVNLNRATEGLRVVEEICRFVLEDQKLTLSIKQLRGELSRVVKPELRSRDAAGDVGKEPYTRDEGRRANFVNVFYANMKRAQEAVRCLEEFSKLISPKFGKAYKNIRFRLYELEKKIAPRILKAVRLDFDLYVVVDSTPESLATLRKAIAGGVKIIQFRDKEISKQKYLRLAKKMVKLTRRAGATFILNDYWDLVNAVRGDGVHLGQDDLARVSFRRVRKKLGEDKIIGISTYTLAQALRAEKEGADYISVWPIFVTPIKPQIKPVGIKLLRKVVKRVKIPVVAIGGINKTNIKNVLDTGCRRVAVIRAARELISQRQKLFSLL